MLVVLSAIGYGLLRFDWPRAPFVIGIVLGKIAEESLHKALELWGLGFFTRPLSLVLIGLIVDHHRLCGVSERAAAARQATAAGGAMKSIPAPMTLVMLAIFTAMVGVATTYPPAARFMPFVVGIPAIALCLLQLALDLYRRRAPEAGETGERLKAAEDQVARIAGRRVAIRHAVGERDVHREHARRPRETCAARSSSGATSSGSSPASCCSASGSRCRSS